ncbi:MAG TPA: 16S rRNA (cytosine(967)-C(5))-methyltransferase RsmB [Rhodothermales bacterium]
MPASVSAARRLAVEQLIRMAEEGTFVGHAVVPRDEEVTPRDERQSTDYVGGVTRWRRWLDFVLSHFVRMELDQLEPALRQILRLGLYDLLILQTPPHAAVNEAVELTRVFVRPQAARLTNGVLRNVDRARERLPEPDSPDAAERLAIRHSHPTWMVQRWLNRYGESATERLLQMNNARPAYGLRVNVLRTSVEKYQEMLTGLGVEWEASPWIPYFLRVHQLQPIIAAGHLAEGLVAVQDESAGLIVRVLDPLPGERILDLCAAPGGKAIHAAQLMENRGEVLAVDLHESRLRLVSDAASTQGATIVRCLAADGRDLSEAEVGIFDRVLVDAPCSGLGVVARRADLRWNRTEEQIRELTVLQDELLDSAAQMVRPGGVLVYGTCTIEPEENEERVRAFLQRNPAYSVESAHEFVPSETGTPEGFMVTLPQVHRTDGAFAARLRRAE